MTQNDGWTFVPEDGRPSRLIRMTTLHGGLLATYDHDKNLVMVDQQYFDVLDNIDQGRVLATRNDLYTTIRGDRVSVK